MLYIVSECQTRGESAWGFESAGTQVEYPAIIKIKALMAHAPCVFFSQHHICERPGQNRVQL